MLSAVVVLYTHRIKEHGKNKKKNYKKNQRKTKRTKEKPKKPLKLKSVKPSPELHQRKEIEKEKPKYEKAKKLIKDTTPEAHKVVKELVGGKMTKLLVEDQGGLTHIYPLHHDKILKLYS